MASINEVYPGFNSNGGYFSIAEPKYRDNNEIMNMFNSNLNSKQTIEKFDGSQGENTIRIPKPPTTSTLDRVEKYRYYDHEPSGYNGIDIESQYLGSNTYRSPMSKDFNLLSKDLENELYAQTDLLTHDNALKHINTCFLCKEKVLKLFKSELNGKVENFSGSGYRNMNENDRIDDFLEILTFILIGVALIIILDYAVQFGIAKK